MLSGVVDHDLGNGVVVAGDRGNPGGDDVIEKPLRVVDLAAFPREPTVLGLVMKMNKAFKTKQYVSS